MKKNIVNIMLAVLMATPVVAQTAAPVETAQPSEPQHYSQGHVITLGFGTGISGLSCELEQGTSSVHFPDFTANLRYTYYFYKWMGFTTGLDFSTYSANMKLNGTFAWENSMDPSLLTEDKSYTHILDFSDNAKSQSTWKEYQKVFVFEVPIALSFKYKPNKVGLLGTAGIKIGIPFSGTFRSSGTLNHCGTINAMGQAEPVVLTPTTAQDHFISEEISADKMNGKINRSNFAAVSASLFAEFGALFEVHPRIDLSLSLYASYGMNDLNGTEHAKREELGFGTVTNGYAKDVKISGINRPKIMNEYNGLIGTKAVDKINQWNFGLKFGVHINASSKSDEQLAAENFIAPTVVYVRDTITRVDTLTEIHRDTIQKEVFIHDTVKVIEKAAREVEKLAAKSVIYFHVGDYTNPIVEPVYMLDSVAAILVRYPELQVSVEGHASKDGNAAKNKTLALNRAKAVAEELQTKGVRDRQIIVRSYGSDHPFYYGTQAANDPNKDRRVEIIPVKK